MVESRAKASLAALAVASLVTTAGASGPSPSSKFADFQVCKGGSNKGADCMSDVECPGSKCVIDWVKGKGSTMSGTITGFYDDQTRDWRDQLDTGFKALSVIVEVKSKGQKQIFAETYHEADGAHLQPEVSGWGGLPFEESDWTSTLFCDSFWYARPENDLADALRAMAGQPPGKTPVVRKVKGKTETYDHSGSGDPIGTTVRCKVTIGFFNEP